MKKTCSLLIFFAWLLFIDSHANKPVPAFPAESGGIDSTVTGKPKKAGHFFITPFYQYTKFKNLKLISSTNYYKVTGAETADPYSQHLIDKYNKHYDTEYTNSMMGLKFGYQVLNGLGVSVYGGLSNFILKSWVSKENTQTLSTQEPAVSLGVSVDYERILWKDLRAMALVSFNYCKTGFGLSTTTSGADIISSKLTDIYWEANLALGYRFGRFVPYAGAGFTQQFINPVITEQYVTTNDNGNPYTEQDRFDSHFRGMSVYGFAGLDFTVNRMLSFYARGAFLNPARATFGINFTF